MKTVIGIGIGEPGIRAVAVRGGAVIWKSELVCVAEDSVRQAMLRLLQRAPVRRWPRPAVIVAVGPGRSQTKRLVGLPPVTDAIALAQIVREGAGRFFLRNGVPLMTSPVHIVEPGVAWAAALDATLVRELEAACGAAKITLRAIVPAAVVVGAAFEPTGDAITWSDGNFHLLLTTAAGRLTSVRRLSDTSSHHMEARDAARPASSADNSVREERAHLPPVVPALAALGDDAGRFADAFGAALVPASEPLALRPGEGALNAPVIPRWRHVVAECACVVSIASVLLAPGLAVTRARHAATEQLSSLSTRHAEAAASARELGEVSAALARVAEFDGTRKSTIVLLQRFTDALPGGSALVTLRVDSTGGTLVALAPRAGAMVSALENTPGITAPEIVGPVTLETVGADELERVTVHFQIDATALSLRDGQAADRRIVKGKGS